MEKEFIVLYTGQKLKKAKTWHDGILKHDGRGTKTPVEFIVVGDMERFRAMLYDEKGSRLDSIHIKVQDITIGEQLESDRYFILVETLKTRTDKSDVYIHQSQPLLEETSASQRGTYSQARCAGLKRKKTGFMPPRLVKQSRQDEQDSQERSPLRLHNRIYPTHSVSSPALGQTADGKPQVQQMAYNANNSAIGGNVLNMYSNNQRTSQEGYSLYSNIKGGKAGCEVQSPSTNSSTSSSPALPLSPWSVYGSTRNNRTSHSSGGNTTVTDRKEHSINMFGSNKIEDEKPEINRENVQLGEVHGDKGTKRLEQFSPSLDFGQPIESRNKSEMKRIVPLDSDSDQNYESTKPTQSRSMKAIMDLLRKNKENKSNEQSTVVKCDTKCGDWNRGPIENNLKLTLNTNSVDNCDRKDIESLSPSLSQETSYSLDKTDVAEMNICTDKALIDSYGSPKEKLTDSLNDFVGGKEDGVADSLMPAEDNILSRGNFTGKQPTDQYPDHSAHSNNEKHKSVSKNSDSARSHNIKNDFMINSTPTEVTHQATTDIASYGSEEGSDICFSINYSPLSHASLSDSEEVSRDENVRENDINNTADDKLTPNVNNEDSGITSNNQAGILLVDMAENQKQIETNSISDFIDGAEIPTHENNENMEQNMREKEMILSSQNEELNNDESQGSSDGNSKNTNNLVTDMEGVERDLENSKESQNVNVETAQDSTMLTSTRQTSVEENQMKCSKADFVRGTVDHQQSLSQSLFIRLSTERRFVDESSCLSTERGTVDKVDCLSTERGTVDKVGSLSTERGNVDKVGSLSTERGTVDKVDCLSTERGTVDKVGSLSTERGTVDKVGSLSTERGTVDKVGSLSTERGTVDKVDCLSTERGTVDKVDCLCTERGNVFEAFCLFTERGNVDKSSCLSNERGNVDNTVCSATEKGIVAKASCLFTERGTVDKSSCLSTERGTVDKSSCLSNERVVVDKSTYLSTERGVVDKSSCLSTEREVVDKSTCLSTERGVVDKSSCLSNERGVVDKASCLSTERGVVDKASGLSTERGVVDKVSCLSAERGNVDESSCLSTERGVIDKSSCLSAERGVVDKASCLSTERMTVDKSSYSSTELETVDKFSWLSTERGVVDKASCLSTERGVVDRKSCLSTESQDTMEFSCDTLCDESQDLLLSPSEMICHDMVSDKTGQEIIPQELEKETVKDEDHNIPLYRDNCLPSQTVKDELFWAKGEVDGMRDSGTGGCWDKGENKNEISSGKDEVHEISQSVETREGIDSDYVGEPGLQEDTGTGVSHFLERRQTYDSYIVKGLDKDTVAGIGRFAIRGHTTDINSRTNGIHDDKVLRVCQFVDTGLGASNNSLHEDAFKRLSSFADRRQHVGKDLANVDRVIGGRKIVHTGLRSNNNALHEDTFKGLSQFADREHRVGNDLLNVDRVVGRRKVVDTGLRANYNGLHEDAFKGLSQLAESDRGHRVGNIFVNEDQLGRGKEYIGSGLRAKNKSVHGNAFKGLNQNDERRQHAGEDLANVDRIPRRTEFVGECWAVDDVVNSDAHFEGRLAGLQEQITGPQSTQMSRIFQDSRISTAEMTRTGLQAYTMTGVKYATVSRQPDIDSRSLQGQRSFTGSPCGMKEMNCNTIMSVSPSEDSVVPEYSESVVPEYNYDAAISNTPAADDDVYSQLYKPRPMYQQVKVTEDYNPEGQGQSQYPEARSSLQQYRNELAESRRLKSQLFPKALEELVNESSEMSQQYKNMLTLEMDHSESHIYNPVLETDLNDDQFKNIPVARTGYLDKQFQNTPMSDSLSFLSNDSVEFNVDALIRSGREREFSMQDEISQNGLDYHRTALKQECAIQDQTSHADGDIDRMDLKEDLSPNHQHIKTEQELIGSLSDDHVITEVERPDSKYSERSKWDQYVPDQTEDEIDLNKYKRREPVNRDFSVVEAVRHSATQVEKSINLESPALKQSDKSTACVNRPKSIIISQQALKEDFMHDEYLMSERNISMNKNSNATYNNSSKDYVTINDPVCDMKDGDMIVNNDILNNYVADKHGEYDETKTMQPCESEQLSNSEKASECYGSRVQANNRISYGENDNKDVRTNSQQKSYNWGDINSFKTGESDKKNDVNNIDSQSNSIGVSLENKEESTMNDSLDFSLSFEDQPEDLTSDKSHNFLQHPSMRVGWKPQQHNVNVERTETVIEKENVIVTSEGKEEIKPGEKEKIKPTFRCLKILARSRLSPNRERTSPNDNSNIGSCVSVSNIKQNENDDIGQPGKSAQNQFKHVNVGNTLQASSAIKSVGSSYKSPVLCNKMSNDMKSLHPVTRQQFGKRLRPPGMIQSQSLAEPRSSPNGPNTSPSVNTKHQSGLKLNCTELCFPGCETVEYNQCITRQVVIPESFTSVHQYKQVLTSVVLENLNSMLFDISKRYHQAMSRIDISGYSNSAVLSSSGPSVLCKCGTAAKILSVRKEGPNQGRQFYGCSKNSQQRCKFFQWADGKVSQFNSGSANKRKVSDGTSLGYYMKDQHVHFYPECQLIRKSKENIHHYFKRPKWVRGNHEEDTVQKKQLFLKLPRKGHSSLYAKDDIWIVSRDLHFQPSKTFLAGSVFYGPLASNEVEIEPLYGYSPSNWSGEVTCHGLLAGNASTELNCLENIREHLTMQSPPVLSHLLNRDRQSVIGHGSSGFSAPRMVSLSSFSDHGGLLRRDVMDEMVCRYIEGYRLNTDQTEALRRVSHMFCQEKAESVDNVLLLHGVFGAGKSFLLSVMVLFLVEVFKMITPNSAPSGNQVVWKLLISSTTNVAVDRILQGVLELGFEDFVRVGSVKKIAKPILPYSIHASGTDNQELKDLQEMLRSNDLTPAEKSHVRQSIEKHRHGENKKKLGAVKVVGVTCASCSVASLNSMQFPVVFLDECSQMTEPSSLLPIARFGCQKLLLVGDPKQLDPTIEGAKPAHSQGLEQTMFDRLIKMGYIPTILRTQYRCHPWISAISNQLFYGDLLMNGVTEADRQPILEAIPTICFYDVDRGQEWCEGGGSFYNEQEAQFVVFLLQVLTSSGIESASIGVITLYRSQMSRIMDLIVTCGDDSRMKGIQVSTVDAFQGGERDIIILSCVKTKTCGFIDNDKRTNVALTRAKHHLLIVGHYKNLSNNVIWGRVLQHCRGHKNGVQSADESRQQLELYMEGLPSQTSSQGSDRSNKSQQKPRKSTAKGGKQRKKKAAKDRIASPGFSDACSERESQDSLIDGLSVDALTGQSENSMSEQHGEAFIDVLDDGGKEVDGAEGHMEPLEYQKQQTENCGEQTSSDRGTPSLCPSRSTNTKSKYADRLQSDWFEEEPIHDSDEDLPVFQS